MNFGLSTACLYPQETEKTLEYFCNHQVPVVEVFLNTFSELKLDYLDELRRMCRKAGTKIVSLHPFTSGFEPFMMFTEYERRFTDCVELYKPYFEACSFLGSEVVVLHGDRNDGVMEQERYFERYHRMYLEARRYGVYLAQENVARCKSHSTDFIRAMHRALGEDVRFVLDTKQAMRGGQNVFEMADAMGDRVVHVHLSDQSEIEDCLPPGSGGLDIKRLLFALKSNGFDRNVIIELYRCNFREPIDLLVSLKFLTDLGIMHNYFE